MISFEMTRRFQWGLSLNIVWHMRYNEGDKCAEASWGFDLEDQEKEDEHGL